MNRPLSEIFDIKLINMNFDGKTKEMAFAELVNSIAELNPDCNHSEMLTAIKEREKKMSTGIGNGVAIAHVCCNSIGKMIGAIGISRNGIDYSALDNKPVHIIFMLFTCENTQEVNLQILNRLFKLAQSEAIPLIKNAGNAHDIHAILSKKNLY